MDAALYDEDHGYYSINRRKSGMMPIGNEGDYFTSPVTHPAFGALIALQLREMWQLMGSPDDFAVVEMGAGDGVLASDISDYAEGVLPDLAQSMRYLAVDIVPSAGSCSQVKDLSALPVGINGCVISNELLDSQPVNRFIVMDGAVKEILIDYEKGAFTAVAAAITSPEMEARIQPVSYTHLTLPTILLV